MTTLRDRAHAQHRTFNAAPAYLVVLPIVAALLRSMLVAVKGVEQYHYEPNGDTYNLFFEQFTNQIGTREFVIYNPRDQQRMTSYKLDLLQLTPEQLALDQSRGHYAVHDAPHRHWKYFWFD